MKEKKVGIVVGGGPAPGINSVIRAATIKLTNRGIPVVGILDGFENLMRGETDKIRNLRTEDVSLIHFKGGSILGTARANPTKSQADLDRVLVALTELGINSLITIGGDDTSFTAWKLSQRAGDKLQVIHVPKTIDNDLNLPNVARTFGYASARDFGVQITRSLMSDAATTKRWYFVVAMGRKAGHLALGIGKVSGAHLTIIPEEWPKKDFKIEKVVDTLVAAIIKRRAMGRAYGVAILAEGLAEALSTEEMAKMGTLEYDEYGHPRLAEIAFGKTVKNLVRDELAKLGLKITIVDKDIGYELRSVEPAPFDISYTTELGFSAAKEALSNRTANMVTIQEGKFVPIPFEEMMDLETGRAKMRFVNTETETYEVAVEYMTRLKSVDLSNLDLLEKMASTAGMSAAEFKSRFAPIATRLDGVKN